MDIDKENWTSHTPQEADQLGQIGIQLKELVKDNPEFNRVSTADEARLVIRAARRELMLTLLAQETHEHWLDDCGDDLVRTTETWAKLFDLYWSNDGEIDVEKFNAAMEELKEGWGV